MKSENTLKKRAYEIGYRISKGFTRSGNSISRDCYGERFTGYMIIDPATNGIIAGADSGYMYTLALADVECCLRGIYDTLGLEW